LEKHSLRDGFAGIVDAIEEEIPGYCSSCEVGVWRSGTTGDDMGSGTVVFGADVAGCVELVAEIVFGAVEVGAGYETHSFVGGAVVTGSNETAVKSLVFGDDHEIEIGGLVDHGGFPDAGEVWRDLGKGWESGGSEEEEL